MDEDQSKEVRRRGLLKYLAPVVLSIWAVGFAGVVTSYLRAPLRRGSGIGTVRAGRADELQPGQARMVRHGGSPFYVVRLVDGELLALSALCTHYRCVLNWNSETRTFFCPCHEGVFDASGSVLSGLPSRDLPLLRTEVRLGEILVHVDS